MITHHRILELARKTDSETLSNEEIQLVLNSLKHINEVMVQQKILKEQTTEIINACSKLMQFIPSSLIFENDHFYFKDEQSLFSTFQSYSSKRSAKVYENRYNNGTWALLIQNLVQNKTIDLWNGIFDNRLDAENQAKNWIINSKIHYKGQVWEISPLTE